MATAQGTVKKTPLSAFSRPRANGIIAASLDAADCLVGVALTDGQRDILLATTDGKAIRFAEDQVRPMGREAAGVRGIRLTDNQRVTSLIVLAEGPILTVSERGYGKLTEMDDFPRHGRAGQGVIALQTSERNGALVGARQVQRDDEVMLINSCGSRMARSWSGSSVSRATTRRAAKGPAESGAAGACASTTFPRVPLRCRCPSWSRRATSCSTGRAGCR
jgi:DNA gyrase subunit A